MIQRSAEQRVLDALARQAAVVLIGPRQVGKTTLALGIAGTRPSVYLDLESAADRDKLSDPRLFLEPREDRLVVLDEIHRVPDLFSELRGLIDRGRRRGRRHGRFLMLGSASMDLLRQSGESLAGRIEYVELTGLTAIETGLDGAVDDAIDGQADRLWLRGGWPDSYLAASDRDSLAFRRSFVRSYVECEIPQLGWSIPAETLQRLWTMLAHSQGQLSNASTLAKGLLVSVPTINRYLALMVDLLLVRRLVPFATNARKRLVKSPKLYLRDSGLVHALLGIESDDDLAGHPVIGASWEGHVIESLIASAPDGARASFYRTADGAEIDLVLELSGRHGRWAIEIKRALAVSLTRGFHEARVALAPDRTWVVHAGEDRYPLGDGVEVVGMRELSERLAAL